MRRVGVAALWIATIVVTWQVVRATTESSPPAAQQRHASTPARQGRARIEVTRPAVVAPTAAIDPDEPDDAVFVAALATLQRDIADGRWSLADRDRLDLALPRVTGEQAAQLLAVLFPKLNDGTIKSDVGGPPI